MRDLCVDLIGLDVSQKMEYYKTGNLRRISVTIECSCVNGAHNVESILSIKFSHAMNAEFASE